MNRILAVAVAFVVPIPILAQARPDSGTFVTRLGADTLAVERFVRRGSRVEADVVLRIPRTMRTRYVLELSESGELVRLESTTLDPQSQAGAGRRFAPLHGL